VSSTISERLDPRRSASRAFTTRQLGDPAGFVRTRGVVLRAGRWGAPRLTGPLTDSLVTPSAREASGKVAVVQADGRDVEVRAYQRSLSGHDARAVACSNATAAAGAAHGDCGEASFTLALPGRHRVRVDVATSLVSGAQGEIEVAQTWRDVRVEVRDAGIVDGRRIAVCAGPLNDYLLVAASADESISVLTTDDARRLWKQFGFLRTPLRARLAFVAPAARLPQVAFFTCGGREHPSAPLTGLAVLAAARDQLGWPPLQGADTVETGLGPIALPGVRFTTPGIATVGFPSVVVQLQPV
jgi:hypothetical protein